MPLFSLFGVKPIRWRGVGLGSFVWARLCDVGTLFHVKWSFV